jgi:hypothetical protein
VVPLALLATEKAVPPPLDFVIVLAAGALNWPPTLERLRPAAAVVLSKLARRRSIVAVEMSTAAPLSASIVLVPVPPGATGATASVRPVPVPETPSAVPAAA